MDVVEHQDGRGFQPVEQPRDAGGRDLFANDCRASAPDGVGCGDLADRTREIGEERRRIVVLVADRVPRKRTRVATRPLGEQRRLPVTRRCRDDDVRGARNAQPVHEAGPRNRQRPRRFRLVDDERRVYVMCTNAARRTHGRLPDDLDNGGPCRRVDRRYSPRTPLE